jgi:Uma2 family endonuclease
MIAERARSAEPLSVKDFLDFVETRPDTERWELHDGVLVMMDEPVVGHQMVAGNLDRALAPQLRHHGCQSLREVAVARSQDSRTSLVPDVIVRCGPIDRRQRFVTDPIVIIEALSPSTAHYDRGYKLDRYREFETIRQVVLVDPDEARVEVWLRDEASGWAQWPVVLRSMDERLELPSVGASVTLAEIYEDIFLT